MENKFWVKDVKLEHDEKYYKSTNQLVIKITHIPTNINISTVGVNYRDNYPIFDCLKRIEILVNDHYEKEKEKGFKKAEDIGLSKEQTTFGENNLSYPSLKEIKLLREEVIKELMRYNTKYVVFSQPEELKCMLQIGFRD